MSSAVFLVPAIFFGLSLRANAGVTALSPRCSSVQSIFFGQARATSATVVMEELTLSGLRRTSEEFVRDEIGFESGCTITLADAEAAAQRLRNTNFFVSVKFFHEKISENSIRLNFVFEEKWTLTPVVRAGSGGGVTFLVLGLYDLNALGAGIESGAQYEQYAGAPGVSIWWRDPHVGSRDWKVSLEYAQLSRPAFFLHPTDLIYYTPLSRVTRFSVMGYRRFADWEVGLGIEPMEKRLISSDFKSPLVFQDFATPSESGINVKSVLRFNKINLDDFRLDGFRSEIGGEILLPVSSLGQKNPVVRVHGQNLFFKNFADRHNAGLRAQASWVSSGRLLELVRLGSLDSVRGLSDGERVGRLLWLANAEYRYASYLSHWLALQNVVFLDSGNCGVDFGTWPYPVAVSAGTGIRMGFRPIARLRFRADYAFGLHGMRRRQSWVVGMQQYF